MPPPLQDSVFGSICQQAWFGSTQLQGLDSSRSHPACSDISTGDLGAVGLGEALTGRDVATA